MTSPSKSWVQVGGRWVTRDAAYELELGTEALHRQQREKGPSTTGKSVPLFPESEYLEASRFSLEAAYREAVSGT